MTGRKKSALLLLVLTAVLGGIYWAFSDTPYTVFVGVVYAIAGSVLFLFFLLVNGGFRSLKNEGGSSPRPDLFRLGPEKQERAARLLLTLAVPFLFVLLADWVYLRFFYKD